MNTKEKIAVMQAWLDGKTIQLLTLANHAWTDVSRDREPRWDWSECSYRIKPKEKTSIPATDEEITKILSWDIVMKSKNDGTLAVPVGYIKEECKEHFPNYYTLNPKTKCWEDWREE